MFFGTAGALQYCVWRSVGGSSSGNIGCIPATAFSNTASGYSINTVNGGGLQYMLKDTGLAGDGGVADAEYNGTAGCEERERDAADHGHRVAMLACERDRSAVGNGIRLRKRWRKRRTDR